MLLLPNMSQERIKIKTVNGAESKQLRAAILAYYTGDIKQTVKAMKRDGVAVTAQTVARIVKEPRVIAALNQNPLDVKKKLYTKEDLQSFWQNILTAPSVDTVTMPDGKEHHITGPAFSERLKASELYGKSIAAFTEKVEHSGAVMLGIASLLDFDKQQNSEK